MLLTAAEADLVQGRVAAALHRLGFGAGDRFAVSATSTVDLVNVTMGALRVGVAPVVLNTGLVDHERSEILADADPMPVFGALVAGDAELARLCEHGGSAELAPVPLARPMMYTSGTTGRPKGVWSGVLDLHDATRLWDEEIELWGCERADRYLQIGPLYHSAPLRFAICTLLAGGTVIVPGAFDARRASAAIAEHRPTFTFAAPVHLQRIFRTATDAAALRSFRLVAHAGAPCPPALKAEAVERLPAGSVWEFYGSTEGQFTVCPPDVWAEAPLSVGRARPNRELRVEDGMIWCRAPGWARFGYWRDAARTAATWRHDERGDWFTVGDLGRLDDEGRLYLEGRRTDLIISGGVNVYPLEVERELRIDGRIADIAVFGVDDDEWGQAVWAAVVTDLTEADLAALARRELAPHKRPKRWLVVDGLPTTTTGKVQRHRLAETFAADR